MFDGRTSVAEISILPLLKLGQEYVVFANFLRETGAYRADVRDGLYPVVDGAVRRLPETPLGVDVDESVGVTVDRFADAYRQATVACP